jgi:hypothetical protein
MQRLAHGFIIQQNAFLASRFARIIAHVLTPQFMSGGSGISLLIELGRILESGSAKMSGPRNLRFSFLRPDLSQLFGRCFFKISVARIAWN